MRPRRYSSEAIVLSRKNYSEADRILVVFTKTYGKLGLMAKGVRKLKSRKRGSIEVFSNIKFSASRGKTLDIISEVVLINSFRKIRDNLKKVSLAYFFVEVVDRIAQAEEKNEDMYDMLLSYLKKIRTENKLRLLKDEFIKNILVGAGFWPKDKKLVNPTKTLESILERKIYSARVGKKMLS